MSLTLYTVGLVLSTTVGLLHFFALRLRLWPTSLHIWLVLAAVTVLGVLAVPALYLLGRAMARPHLTMR